MGARQQPFAGACVELLLRPVVIAAVAQGDVTLPAVGVHAGAGSDVGGDEVVQRAPGRVVQQLQAQPSRASTADLDGDADQGLVVAATPAVLGTTAADQTLVDFDRTDKRLARGSNHRPAQLVQHEPRRLIPGDPKLALQKYIGG